jgi:hypothetical protein
MRIQLFIGEGWAPFVPNESETVTWDLPGAATLDLAASTEKLAALFEDRVRDVYPDAEIEVAPHWSGEGQLVAVDLTGDPAETADEALAMTAEDLAEGGYVPAEMIAGEIEGLLDGLIQQQTHSWQVEK